MNIVGEYLKRSGKTQAQLAEDLKEIQPGINQAAVSMMLRGVVRPSEEVQTYLSEAIISHLSGINAQGGVIYQPLAENPSERPIWADLINALKGSAGAVSRENLCTILGISDRRLRNIKAAAIDDGQIIGSSSRTNGYYIPDAEEMRATKAENIARIKALHRHNRAIDRALEKISGQIELDI